MPSAFDISDKTGHGLATDDFVERMRPTYREKMEPWQAAFSWKHHPEDKLLALQSRDDLHCAVLASDWCGDVHRNFPVIVEVMRKAGVPVEVFIQEEHPDFIEQFRTLGGTSVPKVVVSDEHGKVYFSWGPRPAFIQEPMKHFKSLGLTENDEAYADERSAAYESIFSRYGDDADYQRLVVYELTNLLEQC